MEELLLLALIIDRARVYDFSPLPSTEREEPKLPNQWESSVNPQKFWKSQLVLEVLRPQVYGPPSGASSQLGAS